MASKGRDGTQGARAAPGAGKAKLPESAAAEAGGTGGPAGAESVDFLVDRWAKIRPDLSSAGMATMVQIERIVFHADRIVKSAVEGTALSVTDVPMLVMIRRGRSEGEPIRVSDVWRHFDIAPSALAYRINRWEQDGLVTRTRSTKDKRDVFLDLTAEGARAIDVAMTAVSRQFDAVISSDEGLKRNHAQLNSLLSQVVHRWEEFERDQPGPGEPS